MSYSDVTLPDLKPVVSLDRVWQCPGVESSSSE